VKLNTSARGFVLTHTNGARRSSHRVRKNSCAAGLQKFRAVIGDFVSLSVPTSHNSVDEGVSAL
jgi:hypothetical protein